MKQDAETLALPGTDQIDPCMNFICLTTLPKNHIIIQEDISEDVAINQSL